MKDALKTCLLFALCLLASACPAQIFTPAPPASPLVPYVFRPAPGVLIPGPPGRDGTAGPAGAPGAGVGYSAALSGVLANTQADQAPALTTALLASKSLGTGVVTLPPGLMLLRSPLAFGGSPGFDGGIHLIGGGINAQGQTTQRGSTIQAGAAGLDAVLLGPTNAQVGGVVADLTLKGYGSDGSTDTRCGIHFDGTNWTNFSLTRLSIQNVGTAILVNYVTGNANGENLLIDHCLGTNVNVWYQNTSDQAYAHTEVASGAGLNESVSSTQYSTVYRLMSLGQNFYSLHGSSSFSTAVNNPLTVYNTFVENVGADQDVHDGGRCEHVGRIVKISGGTPSKISTITIRNYHFTDMVDGSCLVQASSVNGQFNVVFEDCEFDSPTGGGSATPTATLNVLQALDGDPNCRITLRRPRFSGFKIINLGAAPAAGQYKGVIYEDGWQMGAVGTLTPVSNVSSAGQPVLSINN